MSFFACPAKIKDSDGREWRTEITVSLGLTDLVDSGFAESAMDEFAQLGGCIDIKELQQLCQRIGKDSMARDQWLTLEFVCPTLPAESEQLSASRPFVGYRVDKRSHSIRQYFNASVPTRCQYAVGARCTHDQHIDVGLALETSRPVSVAVLNGVVARSAGCIITGLLKPSVASELLPAGNRGAEKYIQNIAEEIFAQLRSRTSVKGVHVRCECAETIHNYHGAGQVSDLDWQPNMNPRL